MDMLTDFVIVGGGISGVTCAETISQLSPEYSIKLVTASPLIKTVVNFRQITERIENFDVEEKSKTYLEQTCSNVEVIEGIVRELDSENHIIKTVDGLTMKYRKVCFCTGGKPKVIADNNPYVLGIRDTESVKEFQKKLKDATRIIVIGNGGIATELVYEVERCEVIWAIKDKSISNTFVDAGAAQFFLPSVNKDKKELNTPLKRHKYSIDDDKTVSTGISGGALGPDWSNNLNMAGKQQASHQVYIEYNVEVKHVLTPEEMKNKIEHNPPLFNSKTTEKWSVYVELTNGQIYGSDFIVSATGVEPNSQQILSTQNFVIGDDGGIVVNDKMETSIKDVYAAGDICKAGWNPAEHWLQMRLWSQARQMGCYAAKSMLASVSGENISPDFCFELFTHMTRFFNYKVILLGKFNGQNLGDDQEVLLRVTDGVEYVKAIIKDGRLQGAVLIGETDLEETFENLILNKTDLTMFKEHLLNPGIDIEDFFD